MKTFRADNKLKQATYVFIAGQLLTKAEKESLSKIFKALNVGGDGKLSKQEIKDGYAKYFDKRLNDDEVDKVFEVVDLNKSGFVEFSEFVIAGINER